MASLIRDAVHLAAALLDGPLAHPAVCVDARRHVEPSVRHDAGIEFSRNLLEPIRYLGEIPVSSLSHPTPA
ncbi:hypothetical protein NSPZN2_10785 [Nitrospira defluvii]|uniref:Uncharacterized protein n=1 Tax=Nitrospira defluvii TaxID=330214 RepID=A0ABN7KNG8_9BACT|nr:hypothetical protein NSPZN2_10785 [Nitrospira defluvii]